MIKRAHPRDLEGPSFSPSDLVRNKETVELAIIIFDSMLKAAQHDSPRLESFVRQTIKNMIQVGELTASNEWYTKIINPFYRQYFNEDAQAFVLDRVRYRAVR